ncbi:MAG: leucine-rich repeat domain-containing protein [Firmicutes bacterium]|nr:leucine-rich repeat domain-containing protein [Bacillota bacterium]
MQTKKFLAVIISAIMVFSLTNTLATQAAETARTVTVYRVDGRNADLYRNSTMRRTAPRTNVRISANDTLETGDNTQVYLNLDYTSLLKMDSNSEVNFELTNDLIGLNLQQGNALVQVAEQQNENSIEARLGNLALAVRGTMFTMGHFEEENIVFIVMLSGSGEVDGILLEEGQILTSWYDEDEPQVYISGQIIQDWRNEEVDRNVTISEIYLEELDEFTLREILDNSEYLLENSEFVTEDLLNQIPPLLEDVSVVEAPSPVNVNNRSYRDAQNRWQVAQQNRRAEDIANNQNRRDNQNDDFSDNFVIPQMPQFPPIEQLPIIPPDNGGNGNGNTDEYIVIAGEPVSLNVTILDLTNRGLIDSDIIPLARLTNLTELHLSINNITDITPLAGLTNLTYLNLFFNNISDITPLTGLTNLTTLNLNRNNISDITPLAGLTNLTYLDLYGNDISNITPLTGLTNLIELRLYNNNITDITPLVGLTNLARLSLNSNNITDITPLAGLTNLTYLVLHTNNISNITPLTGLTNLTTLSFYGNSIIDITPLSGLTNLTELYLNHNNIIDITPLAGLTNLRFLSLQSNNITDWSPVNHIDSVAGRPANWPRQINETAIWSTLPTETTQSNYNPTQQNNQDEFWDIDLNNLLPLTPEVGLDENNNPIITIPEFPTVDIDENEENEDSKETPTEENNNPQNNNEDDFLEINLEDLLTLTPQVTPNEVDEDGNPIIIHPIIKNDTEEELKTDETANDL